MPSALRRSDQPLAHASSKGGGECSVAFSCTCSCGNLWHWSAKKSGSSRRSGVCRAVEVSSGAFSTPGSAEVDAAKCRCHAADCCFVALQRLESFVAGGMHEGGRRGALGGIATPKGVRGGRLESNGVPEAEVAAAAAAADDGRALSQPAAATAAPLAPSSFA